MPSRKATLLIVDDDVRMLRMMKRILELEGYRVRTADDGQTALEVFDDGDPDMVLLDIMMPGMNGYALCQNIREFSEIPIIMVTAKVSDREKIEGLDTGADDYVTKPFSANELAARVRAVLRRTKLWDERPKPTFHTGDLEIDFSSHKVTLGNDEVSLTATEYRILSFLAHNVDRTLTPDQILQRVWDKEYARPRYIFTRSGIGYMMQQTCPAG